MAPFVCLLAVLLRVGIVNRYGIQKGLNHLRLFTDVSIGCNVEIFPIIFMGTTFLSSSLILSSSWKSNFRNSSKAFSYGRVLFPWLVHCFSPTCTCIHMRRDCLEIGINNEGYFGYPRFERKHGFHPVWAFQFSLACCLFLCRPLGAFAGFLLL